MDNEMAARAVARALAGIPLPDPLPEFDGMWGQLYKAVAKANGKGRLAAFREAAARYPNAAEIEAQILAMDPRTPPAEEERKRSDRAMATVQEVVAPELPAAARLDPDLGTGAGRWLDEYLDYACRVSELTPRAFHESAGLWLGSLAIARRLVLRLSHKDVYPNMMFLWVAPTTLYAKSTGLNVARRIVYKTMKHLLLPSEMSPEEMVSELAGNQPIQLALEAMEDWQMSRNYAGQRGIMLDEASSLFVGMKKDYNIGLAESILRLYDCVDEYVRQTRSTGRSVIRKAYLTFIGATTPWALRRADLGLLWNSGLWPRFALVTADEPPSWFTPEVKPRPEPVSLLSRLTRLTGKELPVSTYNEPPVALGMRLGEGVHQAYSVYLKATMRTMLLPPYAVGEEMHGVYGRLAEQALKATMILAALDWDGEGTPTIEMRHWARGQALAEGWRLSAHRLAVMLERQEEFDLEDQVVLRLREAGGEGLTLRDLYRALHRRRAEVEMVLTGLLADNVAEEFQEERSGRGRRAKRFRLVR